MEFILDLIIQSLANNVPVLYNRFLKVLKESEDLVTRELAKELGKLIHIISNHNHVIICVQLLQC